MSQVNRFAALTEPDEPTQNALDIEPDLPDTSVTCFSAHPTQWLTDSETRLFRCDAENDPSAKDEACAAFQRSDSVRSFLGLDAPQAPLVYADVRAKPTDADPGYATTACQGGQPNLAKVVATLLTRAELIRNCQTLYLIVDNRPPSKVLYWPAFSEWWASRRQLS